MSLPPLRLRSGLGATYRVQLRPDFGFRAAAAIVPYLARLGVQTLYLSPVAEAVPGSTHGYDGTDPTTLRAELGGASDYDVLVAACVDHGLGICIDHVPNHLATWPGGAWWRQLLAEGLGAPIAEVFDVDWDAGGGKVNLPLLEGPLKGAIADGTVRLGERGGEPVVFVGGVDLPLAAGTGGSGGTADCGGAGSPGGVLGARDVASVLESQHYRLTDWHDPRARNYRRFFDIDGLVGVRVEVPGVFERTHELVIELARTRRVSALRIDHVDGLLRPTEYLRRLAAETGVPIVVEKILAGDERLRADWPVVGTTGYETLDDLGGLLVDRHGLRQLAEAGRREGDEAVDDLTVETRRLVARASFVAEVERSASRLDVDPDSFRDVVTRLPRYRTYLDAVGSTTPGDRATSSALWHELDETAVWRALRAQASPGAADEVIDAILTPEQRDVALRVQQLTGAIMAKGIEDTAWYRLAGPLAFCEVGGDPAQHRDNAVQRWHDRAAERVARGVHGLVPATTHDTKRAQDVRNRLYALTEMAGPFEEGLGELRAAVGSDSDRWEGGFAFVTRVAAQLALGVVPLLEESPGAIGDAAWSGEDVAHRLGEALVKGAREAKRWSSWSEPNETHEALLRELAAKLLTDRAALLRRSFGPVFDEATRLGALNSLSSVVLRSTLPGVPDCYQGDEAWNLSLVDPDNRRPVNFEELAHSLEEVARADPDDLRRSWRDGRVKLWVTMRCLQARKGPAGDALAPDAAYLQLAGSGPAAASVCAFARRASAASATDAWAVALVTRLGGRLETDGDDLPAGPSYEGTLCALPDDAPPVLTDVISDRRIVVRGGSVDMAEVFASLPVALLLGAHSQD